MSILQTIKPFWPMLLTFVLPRAIGYYRALRVSLRTRPPPKPLPQRTINGLNALFASICVFLFSSFPLRSATANENIFRSTNSRLHIPTDVLFARLAMSRSPNSLTSREEDLRTKLTTPILRQIYLRFGPSTLLDCSFCHPDDDTSYILYHLPTNILLPHLFHFLVLGLATSETVAGYDASRWRLYALLGGLALLLTDLYFTTSYTNQVDPNMPAPTGLFWLAATLRPLTLCLYDLVVAFVIYASATGRFVLFAVPTQLDPETARRQTETMLNQSNVALQMAQMKLRALSVAKNAILRDDGLKRVDDEYWRSVVAVESADGLGSLEMVDESVWEDEEVQAAIARVYGQGNLDVPRMKKEAETFVKNVTRGLDG